MSNISSIQPLTMSQAGIAFKSNQASLKQTYDLDPRIFGKKTKFNNPTINKWLAGLYSAVSPGLGQVINGESNKVAKYLAPTAIADLLGFVALHKKCIIPAAILFLVSIINRIDCVNDAVKNANNYADPEKAKNLDFNA